MRGMGIQYMQPVLILEQEMQQVRALSRYLLLLNTRRRGVVFHCRDPKGVNLA